MSTSKRAWQTLEQFWANLIGEGRSGPTGRDLPDATYEVAGLGIECKLQDRRVLKSKDIQQARENATKCGVPWVLILHTKGEDRLADDLIIMGSDAFLSLVTHTLPVNPAAVPQGTCDWARERITHLKEHATL